MQKLKFHPTWDRAISPDDRERIERAFQEAKLEADTDIQFTTIRHALNHKKDLLIIVLVHNTGEADFSFDNQKLVLINNNQTIAEHTFTPPTLQIEPQTSMPWTFIFPAGKYVEENFDQGIIALNT